MGAMASPLTGADGNVEFLLHAARRPRAGRRRSPATRLDDAVAEARGRADGRDRLRRCTTSGPQAAELAREHRSTWLVAPRATTSGCPSPTPTSPASASSAVRRGGARPGPRRGGEPRRRRHDAAHRRPGGRRRRADPRRQRRPDGLPHRRSSPGARRPRSSGFLDGRAARSRSGCCSRCAWSAPDGDADAALAFNEAVAREDRRWGTPSASRS